MKHSLLSLVLLAAASGFAAAPDFADVLVYPVRDEGSILHWLQIAPLPWNAAYIGDSQSYDPFKPFGMSELALRPRVGDIVGKGDAQLVGPHVDPRAPELVIIGDF